MFDHLGIVVSDLSKARGFYKPALATLGIKLLQENVMPDGDGWLVFTGEQPFPFFVVASGRPSYWGDDHAPSQSPAHIAFRASSREAVDAFYTSCLEQGGADNGKPGERPVAMGTYYAAYVIDPDGNNIEAGIRGP